MRTIYELRRDNLRALASQWGGPTSLSRKLNHSNGSYLAQLIGPNPSRQISEKVAREVEAKLGLPTGWMDQENGQAPKLDDDMLGDCVRAVGGVLRDAGLKTSPDQYATLVELAYGQWRLSGRLDEQFITKLTRLLR